MPRVVLAAFPGAQGLDVFGPAEVFAGVGRYFELPPPEVVVAAVGGGVVSLSSGVPIVVQDLEGVRPQGDDTVLVVGGGEQAVRAALTDRALVAWLERAARVVRRIGSVCSGSFVLAAAGVLDGLRVATHWSTCDRLAAFRPQLEVDPHAIFVQQGRVWTSAGVTTGIDMALAMVEQDHGAHVADRIASQLVLYARRPGHHSQFSEALVAQAERSDPLASVVSWIRINLRGRLDAPCLAKRAGMSTRTFHRRCVAQLGQTPAKLVENVRVEEARTLLETTSLSVKAIADRCGFGSTAQMARAFARTLGTVPSAYRLVDANTGERPKSRVASVVGRGITA